MPQEKLFPMSYHVKITTYDEPVRRSDVPDLGVADAVLVAGVVAMPDGTIDVNIQSTDGHTKEPMSDDEQFKVWLALTQRLSQSPTLDEGHRNMCLLAFRTFMDFVALGAQMTGGPKPGGGN